MTRKLTQQIVREYVRILGGTFRKDSFGDYILRPYPWNAGHHRGITYHTNDLQDVVDTARVMMSGHERIEDAEEYLTLMVGGK